MMDVLYFPFLEPEPAVLTRMRSLFPNLVLVKPFSGEKKEERQAEPSFLVPEKLDEKLLRAMMQSFRERAQLLGKDAFSEVFQERDEELPPASLALEILGETTEAASRERKEDSLAMAAFFLLEAEAFDRMQQDVFEDLCRVEKARKTMMAALKGEEEKNGRFLPPPLPCRMEDRLRAWMRLVQHCRRVPDVWVTDMPGLAGVLEHFFPEGQADEMNVREAGVPLDLPSGVQGRLFRLGLGSREMASFFHDREKIPEFLWIFCMNTDS